MMIKYQVSKAQKTELNDIIYILRYKHLHFGHFSFAL